MLRSLADEYDGIYRMKFLWQDCIIVTDPLALAAMMGRGEAALSQDP